MSPALPESDSPDPAVDDPRVELAVLRTELALERTHLAWVRTGFTFITAGFVIDKAMAALHEARLLAGTNWVDNSHAIGLTLIIGATLFLGLATILYLRQLRRLARFRTGAVPRFPASAAVGCLVLVLGLVITILILTTEIPPSSGPRPIPPSSLLLK